jgi:hypothetical protein
MNDWNTIEDYENRFKTVESNFNIDGVNLNQNISFLRPDVLYRVEIHNDYVNVSVLKSTKQPTIDVFNPNRPPIYDTVRVRLKSYRIQFINQFGTITEIFQKYGFYEPKRIGFATDVILTEYELSYNGFLIPVLHSHDKIGLLKQ